MRSVWSSSCAVAISPRSGFPTRVTRRCVISRERAKRAVEDLRRKRQQILAFLLRQGLHYPGGRAWTKSHRNWLASQKLEDADRETTRHRAQICSLRYSLDAEEAARAVSAPTSQSCASTCMANWLKNRHARAKHHEIKQAWDGRAAPLPSRPQCDVRHTQSVSIVRMSQHPGRVLECQPYRTRRGSFPPHSPCPPRGFFSSRQVR